MHVNQPARGFLLRSSSRAGYSLTEVMLVLGILAAIAAISWPALMKPWARSEVQAAAHELASQLLAARMRAIEESRVYEFRWQPGTGEFEIRAPHQGRQLPDPNDQGPLRNNPSLDKRDSDELATAAGFDLVEAGSPAILARAKSAAHIRERLTNDVVFESEKLRLQMMPEEFRPAGALEQIEEAERQATEEAKQNTDPAVSAQQLQSLHWQGNIWFYPDGSSTNGRWHLLSADQHEVTVRLRGLTGTVHVGNVRPIVFDLPDDATDLNSLDESATPRPRTEPPPRPSTNEVPSRQR